MFVAQASLQVSNTMTEQEVALSILHVIKLAKNLKKAQSTISGTNSFKGASVSITPKHFGRMGRCDFLGSVKNLHNTPFTHLYMNKG